MIDYTKLDNKVIDTFISLPNTKSTSYVVPLQCSLSTEYTFILISVLRKFNLGFTTNLFRTFSHCHLDF